MDGHDKITSTNTLQTVLTPILTHSLQTTLIIKHIASYLSWMDYLSFRSVNSLTLNTLNPVTGLVKRTDVIKWKLQSIYELLDCLRFRAVYRGRIHSKLGNFNYPLIRVHPVHKSELYIDVGKYYSDVNVLSQLLDGLYLNVPSYRVRRIHIVGLNKNNVKFQGLEKPWNEVKQIFQIKNIRLIRGFRSRLSLRVLNRREMNMFMYIYRK